MTRSHSLFAFFYAVALQWSEPPRLLGFEIDGSIAVLVFVILWAASAIGGFALKLRLRGLSLAFGSIFIVNLCVAVGIWLADIGSHSRDVPMWWLPIGSLIFAAIASTGLLLAVAARSLSPRLL